MARSDAFDRRGNFRHAINEMRNNIGTTCVILTISVTHLAGQNNHESLHQVSRSTSTLSFRLPRTSRRVAGYARFTKNGPNGRRYSKAGRIPCVAREVPSSLSPPFLILGARWSYLVGLSVALPYARTRGARHHARGIQQAASLGVAASV